MEYEGNVYRPPGEWASFILQATIGCSHNGCTFCGMYKDKKFRLRPLNEVIRDIEATAAMYNRFEKIFICDGDSIIIPTADLMKIIEKLKYHFPKARLISTYAGPKSTLTKSPSELKELKEAGLGRAYLGVESGNDYVLKHTNKGADAATILKAGRALVEAGIDLWITILVGLGGTAHSKEHILDTADIINRMEPNHVSSMTYTPVPGTKLYEEIERGEFQVLTPKQCLEETKRLLENIALQNVHFTSDHASNYLPLKGTIRQQTPELIALIDRAISGDTGIRGEYSRGL